MAAYNKSIAAIGAELYNSQLQCISKRYYPADGILPGSSSKLWLLYINLASVPGGQLVNSQLQQYSIVVRNFDDFLIMKALSLISYFLIFLPGSMVLIPWGLFLVTGVFSAEINYKVMIILADTSLILLAYFSTKPMTRLRIIIEVVGFVILILPFVVIAFGWTLRTFNYFLFIAPFSTFAVLYLISLGRSIKIYTKLKVQNV